MRQIANDLYFKQVEQELASGNSVLIPLKGNSMLPFIRNGLDKVLLVAVKDTANATIYISDEGNACQRQFAKLDVVLFRYKGKHILHRIIGINDGIYTMQGDGNFSSTESCSVQDIVGLVVEIHRLQNNSNYKIITTGSSSWRFLSLLWFLLRPLRRYLLFLLRKF